jgi:ribose transport system ATP-binding protein
MNRLFMISSQRSLKLVEKLVKDSKIKTPDVGQLVENLSGGNQQKVVIAKWLATACRILIFDEPTRGIDVGAKLEIYELMRRLTKEGLAIIMISSELPEVVGMSDRVLVIRKNAIVKELAGAEIDPETIIAYASGGMK